MIPDHPNGQESQQEFIDLLCRIAKSDDVEEGEIVVLDGDDDEEEGEILGDEKDIEDGEITAESAAEESDDAEEENLRLKALKSLSNVKKKKKRPPKLRRKRTRRDDVDLRPSNRYRTASRYTNSNSNTDDREYLLDKDYRQPSVFDMLLSLITPESRASYPSRQLHDNYDVQQMDIVDDQPPTPLMLPPTVPPPLPPPPPPPPPPMFELLAPPPPIHWPRPTFLPDPWITSFTGHTDIDLRQLPPPLPPPLLPSQLLPSSPPPPLVKRKRSKKHRREKPLPPLKIDDNDEEDEEELRLREELLKTISNKRQAKEKMEPERIVTIIPSPPPPPPPPPPAKPIDNQYTVNNRYKRVKASPSSTSLPTKVEVRPTQPLIQTRNKIVRVTETTTTPTEVEGPQSNPIIITFDDHTSEDEEATTTTTTKPKSNESHQQVNEEERQAIKRLAQNQEEALRRAPPAAVSVEGPPPPSTDELSEVFEKRKILLNERTKYGEIQQKMVKKKIENDQLTKDIERLEEQLKKKRDLMEKNNLLLQFWQKEALSIAQNIKEQEGLILQSPVFKSVRPINTPVKIDTTIETESMKIRELFDEHNVKNRLALFVCPWRLYCEVRPYRNWIEKLTKIDEQRDEKLSTGDSLLRARGFIRTNDDQYWKTCLQAYFTDINQILCPYELQGSCKAQHCLYQHQYQINQRIEEYLTTKKVQQKAFSNLDGLKSVQQFDFDSEFFQKKIEERQYQRCRAKLEKFLEKTADDFRYFSTNVEHSILVNVSNQLDVSDECAVDELVRALENHRDNAQFWSLYLELSSWHMSNTELHQLCLAALKNAQSYELFWTIFDLCPNHIDEYLKLYDDFLQSDKFDHPDRSFAQCELTMFQCHRSDDNDRICELLKVRNSSSSDDLDVEHRLFLFNVQIFTFAFGTFPHLLYEHFHHRTSMTIELEPFISPWYNVQKFAHSIEQIDELFDSICLSEEHLSIHLNKIHFLNATQRFDLAKIHLENLLEKYPNSVELWIEYLLNPENLSREDFSSILFERACETTGVFYELIYSLSSLSIVSTLKEKSAPTSSNSREHFFSDLLSLSSDEKINLNRLFLLTPVEFHRSLVFHLIENRSLIDRPSFQSIVDHLMNYSFHERRLFIYSFFSQLPFGRIFDLIIDCFLTNPQQYQWTFQPFAYRLVDHPSSLFWIRFDGFIKQILHQSSRAEIYLILLQRLIDCNDEKSKINRLCQYLDTHYSHHRFFSMEFRRMIDQIR